MPVKKLTPWLIILLVLVLITGWLLHFSRKNKPDKISCPPPSAAELPWYKQSVIYTLDVEVFQDSDGDGVGDFNGLISKLGYLQSLGVNVLWLAPFQPTPGLDDGYDITNFYAIDPKLGSMQDFERFMNEAKLHHLKVVMDLVANHTSDQHPWFKEAKSDSNNYYHNWYVWSKDRPRNWNIGMVFPGVQHDIWTYDSTAHAFYYHRFYRFQPDLNIQHPPVFEEIKKIIKFWTDKKIDGFRLDGVPFFIEVPEKKGDKFQHQYEKLEALHNYLHTLNKNAIILGEANVLPDESKNFFGENGKGMQMMFNFFVNQHLFYALASGDARPLKKALEETGNIPGVSQWGQFLRNHDELDLGRLTNRERERVYQQFGAEKNMQLYDRGIRRRLAPMLNNNQQQLELAYSLLFALPSTPVIRYGDEIGMGDDLSLRERLAVRTPMQWNAHEHAGFTNGPLPVRPVIEDSIFGYKNVNVANQLPDSNSLLTFTKRMIRLRMQHPEIAYGKWELLRNVHDQVLIIAYYWQNKRLYTVHNFSNKPLQVRLQPDENIPQLTDMLTGKQLITNINSTLNIQLQPYGYKWLYTIKK